MESELSIQAVQDCDSYVAQNFLKKGKKTHFTLKQSFTIAVICVLNVKLHSP